MARLKWAAACISAAVLSACGGGAPNELALAHANDPALATKRPSRGTHPDAPASPAFQPFDVEVTTTAGDAHGPDVARFADGSSLVVWAVQGDMFGQRLDTRGALTGAVLQLGMTDAPGPQRLTVTALSSGGFLLAWAQDLHATTPAGVRQAVHAQRFTASGDPVGERILVSESPVHPGVLDLTVQPTAEGGFDVGWTGKPGRAGLGRAYVQRYAADAVPSGGNVAVSETPGEQSRIELVPLPNGTLVAAWVNTTADAVPVSSVYTRRINRHAEPVGPETEVAASRGSTAIPEIAATGVSHATFALAWHRGDYSLQPSILVQTLGMNGREVTPAVVLPTAPFVYKLNAITLQDHAFAIAWQNERGWNRGTSASIGLQEFDADARMQGASEVLADRLTSWWSSVGPQHGISGKDYAIAGGPDGHVVLVYEGVGNGGSTVHALGR
ncbi:hypothetical protein [Ramlibacter rhizophilus]|uniref:Uncharacterized protein n=1 Tax=Ramlibacter rhizophilus TaxID=1781167 RepID=A0A4Z0C110_9BURK|nr:hypothetical protein [Ramlibacter rhizophilus]TFZ04200.1 hypothetical protein EZ242_00065 [Ramlibacter rhizophilus]